MTFVAAERTSVVGVRFQKLGKLYHFKLDRQHNDVEPGDYVIVETKRGRQLGQIISYISRKKSITSAVFAPLSARQTRATWS